MTGPVNSVPLSILDLAPISAGGDAATALRNTIDLAQHAERWGYRRYWLAEHHFVGVASSATAVLIGPDRGRYQQHSGGIGRRSARVIPPPSRWSRASACSTLSFRAASIWALADPGSGATPGSSRSSRRRKPASRGSGTRSMAWWSRCRSTCAGCSTRSRVQATMGILQQPEAVAPDFTEQLGDIIALLDGSYQVEGFDVHAVPGERSGLTPWIFGSTRGAKRQGGRCARDAVRRQLSHHSGDRAGGHRRLPRRLRAVGNSATAVRRGVGRHRRRRRQRHRQASGQRLRALGVFDPNRRAAPCPTRIPTIALRSPMSSWPW